MNTETKPRLPLQTAHEALRSALLVDLNQPGGVAKATAEYRRALFAVTTMATPRTAAELLAARCSIEILALRIDRPHASPNRMPWPHGPVPPSHARLKALTDAVQDEISVQSITLSTELESRGIDPALNLSDIHEQARLAGHPFETDVEASVALDRMVRVQLATLLDSEPTLPVTDYGTDRMATTEQLARLRSYDKAIAAEGRAATRHLVANNPAVLALRDVNWAGVAATGVVIGTVASIAIATGKAIEAIAPAALDEARAATDSALVLYDDTFQTLAREVYECSGKILEPSSRDSVQQENGWGIGSGAPDPADITSFVEPPSRCISIDIPFL